MRRKEVHVIAGLGGFFTSRGTRALDAMFDDISLEWDATHWYHGSWKKVAEGIIARVTKFKDEPVVCLIGHSYGALRCQQIAELLNKEGIRVDYIAGIDPTALPYKHPPMLIPNNVVYVNEFWSTTGLFNFPRIRRKYSPDGSRGGKYQYPVGWKGKVEKYIIPGGHIPCASDPKTRNIVMTHVERLT